jgi:hypothetical protein
MRESNNGFLIDDFRNVGTSNTAATSKTVRALYDFMRNGFIAGSKTASDTDKVVSANTLSNLYYSDLASSSFFTNHNTYLTTEFLNRNISDTNNHNKPFTSSVTSNLIHKMMTDEIYNILSNNNELESNFNVNDFRKIATAKALYALSNNTDMLLQQLDTYIHNSMRQTTTNLALIDRIRVDNSANNPLQFVHSSASNFDVKFNFDGNYFKVTGGALSVDDSRISNIAAGAIQISSSPDVDGFSNLIEVRQDYDNPGKYEIKFDGTSLLDEVSHDVTKAVANASDKRMSSQTTTTASAFP